MSKKYAIFITVLFCAFLGTFFAANALTPDKDFSPVENRVLAQAPKLQPGKLTSLLPIQAEGNLLNGKFMSDFEEYVTDQFALRDQWIALKAGAEYASNKRENNGVYICDQQTLIPRFDPPSDERAIQRCENNFGYVDTFASLAGVPVHFSLIPDKGAVWSDLLPAGAPYGDEGVYLARGAQTTAHWIDVSTPLTAHKGEPIYYRTDHHWTSLGAYYAYAALMEGMGVTPVPLASYTKTTVSEDFCGTAFSTSGVRWMAPDAMDIYVPQEYATVENNFGQGMESGALYDLDKLADKDKYAMFLGGNKPLTVVKSTTAPPDAPKLMLIRDSFSDSLAPFLCYNFSEIHLVDPRYYKTPMVQYVADNGIDQVLVLYSVDNFVHESNLFVLSMGGK